MDRFFFLISNIKFFGPHFQNFSHFEIILFLRSKCRLSCFKSNHWQHYEHEIGLTQGYEILMKCKWIFIETKILPTMLV